MIKKFERKISTTQSNYKFNLERKYITQQCSYNLPNDIEAYLLSKNAIVRETPNGSNRYVQYGLTDGYKLVLGDSILAIIGEIYRNKANKVIFTHTEGADGSSPKMQLKKTDFASKGDDYKWFVELYNKNIEGVNFITFVDDVAKTLTFDIELTPEIFSDRPIVDEDEDLTAQTIDNVNDNIEAIISFEREISEEDFRVWLSKQTKKDGSNLSEKYQTAYYYMLKAIPSMLDAEDVFEIKELSEFEHYRKTLEDSEKYQQSNPSVGEGTLSASLTQYGKYLAERNLISIPQNRLVEILKDWYDKNYVEGNVTSTLVGFGFKYAKAMDLIKVSTKTLMEQAIGEASMQAYIDRGKDLYYAFEKNSIGFSFCNDSKKKRWLGSILYKTQCNDEIADSDGKVIKLARNRIFFGAPGTGKSYELNEQTKKFIGNDNTYYERVTFHPEYTHSGFFGTYKPVPNPRDVDKITYAFIPGPFLRVLSKALINANSDGEKKPYVLLIEEINRANVASVFGEVFQLLDREDDGTNADFLNASKYSISPSEDVKKYLVDEFKKAGLETTEEAFSDIRIPDNMFIWASMNSADQGVFPMDTAFKRRWEFEYFGINKSEEKIKEYFFKVNEEVINWNALRKAINYRLTSLKINEDKLMGPFFMSNKVLNACTYDHSIVVKAIQNKVIMYLFEDAGRQKRKDIFVNGYEKTYSEICADFEEKGLAIFAKEIVDKYNEIK